MTSAAVVVPVKDFRAAKVRLAPVLDPAQRAALARSLAEVVLAAAQPLPTLVVCDDDDVRTWAEAAGARTLWSPGRGLNGAVSDGIRTLRSEGYDTAVVAHADLPRATSLGWLTRFPGVTLVPDRRRDGTNVLVLPTDANFAIAYGPGSFLRHRSAALASGLPVRIVNDPDLAWDVDVPADLDWAAAHGTDTDTATDTAAPDPR